MSSILEKKRKETEAQVQRLKALKYLAKQDEGIFTSSSSSKVIYDTSDNTLDLLLKEKANIKTLEISKKRQLTEEFYEAKETNQSLSNNWKEVIDSGTGKAYFWNTVTNETTWDRPATALICGTDEKLTGWVKKVHPSTKQEYYFHVETGKITNERPSNLSQVYTSSSYIAVNNSGDSNSSNKRSKK